MKTAPEEELWRPAVDRGELKFHFAFAPADAVSYSAGQINFMGVYSIIKRIAQAAFPQGQQGNADMLDTLYRWSLDLLTGSGTAAWGG